jgi:hypothetical protein
LLSVVVAVVVAHLAQVELLAPPVILVRLQQSMAVVAVVVPIMQVAAQVDHIPAVVAALAVQVLVPVAVAALVVIAEQAAEVIVQHRLLAVAVYQVL